MPLQNKPGISESKRVTVSFSDSIDVDNERVQWTPKGVCLLTKWHFADGVEVEFAFDHQGERHCCSGVVVACHPVHEPDGCFETILYFVDTPGSKLQKAACDCNLARDGHVSAPEKNGRKSKLA